MRNERDLFLHVCCGPCAEWPLEVLLEEKYLVTAFSYNPNIHPRFEHDRRRDNAKKVCDLRGVLFIADDGYLETLWKPQSGEPSGIGEDRCAKCYQIRMDRTAQEAKDRGFFLFSTTLLVSPYQRHDDIIQAGVDAADKYGIRFFYRDFREGFRAGQQMARDHQIYRQKYCGCILSLDESAYRDKIYMDFAGTSGETKTV